MKNFSILIMLVIGLLTKNSIATATPVMGSCVKESTPGTITVLYCGYPNRLVVYSCDPNDTPPQTTPVSACQCPMEDPISVYIPSHCDVVDEIEISSYEIVYP